MVFAANSWTWSSRFNCTGSVLHVWAGNQWNQSYVTLPLCGLAAQSDLWPSRRPFFPSPTTLAADQLFVLLLTSNCWYWSWQSGWWVDLHVTPERSKTAADTNVVLLRWSLVQLFGEHKSDNYLSDLCTHEESTCFSISSTRLISSALWIFVPY